VDQSTIVAEVRAMRCTDYDVNKFTDDFNDKSAKLPSSDPGMRQHLKMLYVDALPYKVKEQLLRSGNYQYMSLQQV
jgi:hypothetical protein